MKILGAVVLTGASGLVAQVIILRELLTRFQGNELSLGIILGNWLLLEAIGSIIGGKKVEHIQRRRAPDRRGAFPQGAETPTDREKQ